MSALGHVVLESLILILALLTAFAYAMLAERKFLGYFQLRVGPNRVGPWGLLQPLADGVKLLLKEDILPAEADPFVYRLAPIVSLFTALAAFAVIPFGPAPERGGRGVLSIADPDAGLLVLLALSSLAVYGVALGGWASQSKYALLGSLRSTAQMISYELAMGLALLGVLIVAGSFRLGDIVAAQARLPFVVVQPLGFLIYFVSSLAEVNRVPFDLPEAEAELVGGYNTEYSGMRFALFAMAEYINLLTVSALATLLYLGGWHGPAFLPGPVWFLLKAGFLVFVYIWIRASLPRLRYDRLMNFGWKVLLPLAGLNLAATAVAVVLFSR